MTDIQITMHRGDKNSFLIERPMRVHVIVLNRFQSQSHEMASAVYGPGLWLVESLQKDGAWTLEFTKVRDVTPPAPVIEPCFGLLEGGDREKLPQLVYTEDYNDSEGNYTLRIRNRGYAEMSSDEDADVTALKLIGLIKEYSDEIEKMMSVFKILLEKK